MFPHQYKTPRIPAPHSVAHKRSQNSRPLKQTFNALMMFLATAPATFIGFPGLPTSEASEALMEAQLMLTEPTSSNVFMSLEDGALSTLFPICWATSATLGHHRSSRSQNSHKKQWKMRARYPKPVLAAFGEACGGAVAFKWHSDGHAQLQKGLDRC